MYRKMLFLMLMMSFSVSQASESEVLNVSWEEYEQKGMELVTAIHESGWEFDQVLCIARGGMLLGDMISRVFKIPFAVTCASSYVEDRGRVQGDELFISEAIAKNTESMGKKILLVDDLVESGKTLKQVKEAVQNSYPEAEIKTATIWKKEQSVFIPDYYIEIVGSKLWIVQPFEKFDDYNPETLPLHNS